MKVRVKNYLIFELRVQALIEEAYLFSECHILKTRFPVYLRAIIGKGIELLRTFRYGKDQILIASLLEHLNINISLALIKVASNGIAGVELLNVAKDQVAFLQVAYDHCEYVHLNKIDVSEGVLSK